MSTQTPDSSEIRKPDTIQRHIWARINELQLMARANPLSYSDPIEREYQNYRLNRIAELSATLTKKTES